MQRKMMMKNLAKMRTMKIGNHWKWNSKLRVHQMQSARQNNKGQLEHLGMYGNYLINYEILSINLFAFLSIQTWACSSRKHRGGSGRKCQPTGEEGAMALAQKRPTGAKSTYAR